MLEERTDGLNKDRIGRVQSIRVAQNITNRYFVSTAMWAGMIRPTYETIIWSWDTEKRERVKLLKHYYHEGREKAIKFHFRFAQTLAWRDLKQNLPNDNAYVELC